MSIMKTSLPNKMKDVLFFSAYLIVYIKNEIVGLTSSILSKNVEHNINKIFFYAIGAL